LQCSACAVCVEVAQETSRSTRQPQMLRAVLTHNIAHDICNAARYTRHVWPTQGQTWHIKHPVWLRQNGTRQGVQKTEANMAHKTPCVADTARASRAGGHTVTLQSWLSARRQRVAATRLPWSSTRRPSHSRDSDTLQSDNVALPLVSTCFPVVQCLCKL
jgi:hypothetical protein